MDPNSSPWSYAYNRIVPSASSSSSAEDFQHPHLASITAAGQSAQSLLLQAAHTNIAASFNAATGGGSFVSPSPISGYNPVFQQIYHHAAASVQPKPAHYASSTVNTPHRQLQIPSLDKQLTSFQNQAAAAAASSAAAAVVNNVASNYYGENSSSSGASPSPTTATVTSTTLSWNTPMISNTFLAMQQQQQQHHHQQHLQQQQHQQQQQLNLVSEKVLIKQESPQTKAQVKAYNDIVYLTHLQERDNEESDISSSAGITHQQLENDTFYTIDGKNYRIVRKQEHPQIQLHQNNSPAAYPTYDSPSLSSTDESPSTGTNLQSSETTPQVIVYKTHPIVTNSTGTGGESPMRTHVASAGSPVASTVAYSSVIQYTLQQQQQMQQQHSTNCWAKIEDTSNGEEVKNILQLQVKQENRPLGYINDSDVSENIIFNLPPGLEIKQTVYNPNLCITTTSSVLQPTQQQQHQILTQQSNNIQHQGYNNNNQKIQHHQQEKQRRQHMVANMLMSPTNSNQQQHLTHTSSSSTASSVTPSQIQIIPKVEEQTKPQPIPPKPAKTPRKRQPKKTLVTNDYSSVRSPQQENTQHHHQQHQQQQQQQQQQQHQQQSTYYDFNNKWNTPSKIENNTPSPVGQTSAISIPTYVNPNATQQQQNITQQHQHQQAQQQQHQQQQQQQIPQPAHLQSSQAQSHPHLTNISAYYPAFPQQIASQYTACVQQSVAAGAIQQTLYNLNQQQEQQQHLQSPQHQQHRQQTQVGQNHQSVPNAMVETIQPPNDISNKVIVPNIEEELGFLTNVVDVKQTYSIMNSAGNNLTTSSVNNNTNFGISNPNITNAAIPSLSSITSNGISSAAGLHNIVEKKTVCVGTLIGEKKTQFMDSYLKFLQGEREDSPPPIVKSGRKISYQKTTGSGSGSKRKNTNEESTQNVDTQEQSTQGTNGDDGHKIKILSQTQILPKKRPHAQIAAAAAAAAAASSNSTESTNATASVIQHPADQIQPQQHQQEQSFRPYSQPQQSQLQQFSAQQQDCNQMGLGLNSSGTSGTSSQDPLSLPPRREQCLRKAKQTSIHAMMMNSTSAGGGNDDQLVEPDEFADSDTDPVWTPQEEDSDDGKGYKRRTIRRNKSSPRKNNYNQQHQQQSQPQQQQQQSLQHNQVPHQQTHIQTIPQHQQNSIINSDYNLNQNLSNSTQFSNSVATAVDNFKTGDFIVLRSDLVNDWPIIWQVDSKCILQKYEPFCQNGKMFYRNMCKYASWNLETKKLYLKAPVRIQIQSHTETIVEFMRSELLADDTEQFIEKIMEDFLSYRDHFEIYIQTMISQVLDPSFFSEITREKDEYFLGSVREIDMIMENCKKKLLSITPWTRSIIISIETWPKCHVFTEWGQNNLTQKNCCGCHQPGISVRFLLFGHPYNSNTMQSVPTDARITYEKDILLCRICAARADIFHKIAHEKYNLYINCSRRVAEQQQENPGKSSTEILNDLLAEHNWVDELFRNMRNSWAEVESLERQNRFREVSQ